MEAQNFKGNISFMKTQTVTMSFMELLALRKAKLCGKYQAPEVVTERELLEVEEEMMEGVRGETSEEVMEERNKREEPKIGGKQRKNISIVKKLKPIEDSGAKSLAPQNGTIKTSAGFMLVSQPDQGEAAENVEVLENKTRGKKRTLSDRLQEPIKVKKAGRCKKVNITSWRNQVLTMKKKASRMQIEAGTEPNFLIIMFNNVQDPFSSNPSASAGKYLTYGEGPIKEKLIKEGLKFDKSIYLMANNYNFAEETVIEENTPEENQVDEQLVENSPIRVDGERRVKKMRIGLEEPKRSEAQEKVAQHQRRMEEEEENKVERGDSSKGLKVTDEAVHEAMRREKVAKKWRPKKVATPGTFLDTLRMSSSEEEE